MSTPDSTISIRCEYTLLRSERARSESHEPQTFTQLHGSGRTVQVELSYSAGSVIAQIDGIYISANAIAELNTLGRSDGDNLTDTTRAAVDKPLSEIRQTVRDLLAIVKYHLRHFDLREGSYSVKSERWFCGASDHREIPTTFSVSVECFSSQPLDARTHDAVQAALESGVLPLVAMRHLHRAKQESQPHHKWIDATIAAELAVKEVLCRAHPAMEMMLNEMPSPPFSKMYGPLLKNYMGEESPYRKKLITGQERRNALVHRPGAILIDEQEANDYVSNVEGAIFHLLSLLYPHDELIRQARYRTAA
jgi:hypothetical protein